LANYEGHFWVLLVNGFVSDKGVEEVDQIKHGPLEIFLWRAKRQWRRWFP
jgi:hypothetical protein